MIYARYGTIPFLEGPGGPETDFLLAGCDRTVIVLVWIYCSQFPLFSKLLGAVGGYLFGGGGCYRDVMGDGSMCKEANTALCNQHPQFSTCSGLSVNSRGSARSAS